MKTTSPKPKRTDRVAEQVRSELMDLVLRGEVRDPRAAGIHIANVLMTADLRQAKVQVRLANDAAPDADHRREVVTALQQASGHLRRLLAPRLNLRYLPELRFYWDDGGDHSLRVHALLAEIGEQKEPLT
jgi:ribosome-binding factor A